MLFALEGLVIIAQRFIAGYARKQSTSPGGTIEFLPTDWILYRYHSAVLPGLVLCHNLILGLAVLALATVDFVNPNF